MPSAGLKVAERHPGMSFWCCFNVYPFYTRISGLSWDFEHEKFLDLTWVHPLFKQRKDLGFILSVNGEKKQVAVYIDA